MVQAMYDSNILIYLMLGLCVIGIIIKSMVSITYARLMKASELMGTSDNNLMKLLRLKFETCYQLKISVNNVETFVDKYVYKHRIKGMLLYSWENAGVQLLIVCVLIGAVGAVLGVVYDCERVDILSTVFVGVLTGGLLIAYENLMNIQNKKCILRVNICDYLENYLKSRLENEFKNPEMIEQYRQEYFETTKQEYGSLLEEDVKELLDNIETIASQRENKAKQNINIEFSKKDEIIIDEILKEYLA